MEHEDHPLRRAELLQHDQQRQPDAVIDGDPVGRIGQRRLGSRCGELDLAGVICPLPAGPGRPYLVQGQTAGHHDKPAAFVVYIAAISSQQTRERVLHDVFGGAEVTEHPECQVNQVRAVLPVSPADRCVVLFPGHTDSSRRAAGR